MKPVIAAVLFVCVLLSACSAGQALPSATAQDAVQSGLASAMTEQTPESSSLSSLSPAQSPTAEPSEETDMDYIPDIVPNGAAPALQSQSQYEDNENKYYLKPNNNNGYHGPYSGDVYLLRKSDAYEEHIINGCLDFTLNKGKIYYSKAKPTNAFAIYSYDIDTKKSSEILTRKNPLYNLLIWGDRLYFCCLEIENAYYENNIYSYTIDGSDMRLLAASTASWFCIISGNIYYIGDCEDDEEYDVSDGYEGEDDGEYEGEDNSEYDDEYEGEYDEYDYQIIYECSLDGNDRRVIEDLNIDGCFGTAGGKLFYNGFNSFIVYDTKTGQKTDLDYDLYDYAIAGQYLIYTLKNNSLFPDDAVFRAYDINTGKIYELLSLPTEIAENYYYIYSESDTCYIFTRNEKDEEVLYRIVIKNGEASIEEAAVIPESLK